MMNTVNRVVQVAGLVVILAWLLPSCLLISIGPQEIGIRKSLVSGVAQEDFELGYHLDLPILHSWYRLPRQLHYLRLTGDPEDGPRLEIRTKENNVIFVSVTVPYRILPREGWMLVSEGNDATYPDKVTSTVTGILREELAQMGNMDVQDTDKRQKITREALPKLNTALKQYHVQAQAIVIRSILFRPEYEEQLQNKQYFIVAGRLDEALRQESQATQQTETLEKTIDKDVTLKTEEWNRKIEELRTQYEVEIAEINAEATKYVAQKRASADAAYSIGTAEGDLAEARAEALGEKLKAEALATQAGRTFSAITAAEQFELGDVTLNSNDPRFLQEFASMSAWRRFFLGQ